MYRLIASDMDETLLNARHEIPQANVEALGRLHELGVMFVPSSGRGYHSIVDNFENVPASYMEGSYCISYNGGSIWRWGADKPLTLHLLDHDLAERLWELGCARDIAMHLHTPDGYVRPRHIPAEEEDYIRSQRLVEPTEATTLDAWPEVTKLLYMSVDFAWLHRLGEEIRPMLGDVADITYSSSRYLEIVPKGVSKGAGLAELARILDIPMAETIALGDSANDLSMIEAAGMGVGVANVTPDVRPHCDLVLDSTADQGALPELLRRVVEPSAA